jgi:hypothetical protein
MIKPDATFKSATHVWVKRFPGEKDLNSPAKAG